MNVEELKVFFEDLNVEQVNIADSYTDSEDSKVLMIDLKQPIKVDLNCKDGMMAFVCNNIDYQMGKLTFFIHDNPIVEQNVANIRNLSWKEADL